MSEQRIDISNNFEQAVAREKEKLEKKVKNRLERQITKQKVWEMHPGARQGKGE